MTRLLMMIHTRQIPAHCATAAFRSALGLYGRWLRHAGPYVVFRTALPKLRAPWRRYMPGCFVRYPAASLHARLNDGERHELRPASRARHSAGETLRFDHQHIAGQLIEYSLGGVAEDET